MASRFSVTEPHPTASKYIHSGRGGAGNTFKAPKTSNGSTATGPASLFEAGLPQSSSKFSSGRGGAGNIHFTSEKATYSFDEELDRQNTREKMMLNGGVYHVGRGGAGNFATNPLLRESGRKDSMSSVDSNLSSGEGFLRRLSHTFRWFSQLLLVLETAYKLCIRNSAFLLSRRIGFTKITEKKHCIIGGALEMFVASSRILIFLFLQTRGKTVWDLRTFTTLAGRLQKHFLSWWFLWISFLAMDIPQILSFLVFLIPGVVFNLWNWLLFGLF